MYEREKSLSPSSSAAEDRGKAPTEPRSSVAFNAYVVPIAPGAARQSVEPSDYLLIIREHWLTLLVWSIVGFLLGLGISFGLPREYRAEVVVAPASDSATEGVARSLGSSLGGLGGLITGALPSSGNNAEYLAVLKSRALIERFIASRGLMQEILRPRGFTALLPVKAREPTMARAVHRFQNDIRSISEDRRTGIVTLSIEWTDRSVAAEWANAYVKLGNDAIREKVSQDSKRTLDYLSQQIEKTSLIDLRQTLFKVVEAQQRTLALAETRPEYAFRIIDPATPPDPTDRSSPVRGIFAGAGLALFLFISAAYYITRHHLAMARK